MRKSIRKSFTGKLLAVVMMLTLLFAAIPTASAATALKTDQKVNISENALNRAILLNFSELRTSRAQQPLRSKQNTHRLFLL